MAHKCYISFKAEDKSYKSAIQASDVAIIDKSLDEAIDSDDEDYIMQTIRSDYLADSTVTLYLIGAHGAEIRGWDEQRFIKRELQGSLYDGENNTKNGILGVVLPCMYDNVYRGDYECRTCGQSHRHVAICDSTTIKEFSYNYYIPNSKCSHPDDERYCVLAKWDDFCQSPGSWIDAAYDKRTAPIASKTKVRP